MNSLRHRNNGPAVIWSFGDQEWWVNGKLHRLDGPAIIWSNGDQEWWVNGNKITDEVNSWMKKRGYKLSSDGQFDNEILSEFLLVFS